MPTFRTLHDDDMNDTIGLSGQGILNQRLGLGYGDSVNSGAESRESSSILHHRKKQRR